MQTLLGLALVAFLPALLSTAANAQCVARKSLNGLWNGSDKGKYHLASNGKDVWWMGDLVQYTNVFHGVIEGDIVTGSWSDVQSSTRHFGSGTLRLQIVRTPGGGIAHLKKIGGSGSGFGAETWTYPCNDTVGSPSR